MNNIIKIFDRITLKFMKQRTLLIILAIQNIILALITLIFSNYIISNTFVEGSLNYDHVRIFFTFGIFSLFIISYIVTPIFLSRTFVLFYNENVIDNLLASNVSVFEIVTSIFLRGITFVIILVVSSIPIISIAFYFGGLGILTILKAFLIVFSYILLFSSVCTYISTRVITISVSMILSYVVGLFILIIYIFALGTILSNMFLVAIFILTSTLLSVILLSSIRHSPLLNL